jgi:predicted site-specific integrase-resolvase
MSPIELLTGRELAKAIRFPHRTIQRWTQTGVIPVIYLGHRTLRYDLEAVKAALLKRTIVAKIGRDRKALLTGKGRRP